MNGLRSASYNATDSNVPVKYIEHQQRSFSSPSAADDETNKVPETAVAPLFQKPGPKIFQKAFKTEGLSLKGMSIQSALVIYFANNLSDDLNWAAPVNTTVRRDLRRVAKHAILLAEPKQQTILQKKSPNGATDPDLFRQYEEELKAVAGELQKAILEKVSKHKNKSMDGTILFEPGRKQRKLPEGKAFVTTVSAKLLEIERETGTKVA